MRILKKMQNLTFLLLEILRSEKRGLVDLRGSYKKIKIIVKLELIGTDRSFIVFNFFSSCN